MKIRVLATPSERKNKQYIGMILAITDGFIYEPFKQDNPIRVPLEQSEWFNATDGQQTFEIRDTKREFVKAIAEKRTGVIDIILGITPDRDKATVPIYQIEILEY